MPRPEGAGRKKGTPNKNTAPLKMKAIELGIDPFEILLLFAKGDWKKLGYKNEMLFTTTQKGDVNEEYTIQPAVRARAAAEACSYLHSKRKAIEIVDDQGNRMAIPVVVLPSNGREDAIGEDE